MDKLQLGRDCVEGRRRACLRASCCAPHLGASAVVAEHCLAPMLRPAVRVAARGRQDALLKQQRCPARVGSLLGHDGKEARAEVLPEVLRDGVAVVAVKDAREDKAARGRGRGGSCRGSRDATSHTPFVASGSSGHKYSILLVRVPSATDRHGAPHNHAEPGVARPPVVTGI